MRGELSETPAADACRALAGDGGTGVLWVDGPDGPGSVSFVGGRVFGATSPAPRGRLFGQEQTLDAMFEIFSWRFGSFVFEPGGSEAGGSEAGEATAAPEAPVGMTVDQALAEVARCQKQWRELSRVIPDLECVPSFASTPASAAASLEPDELAVLARVDGDRSVRALAADLGYGEFELARIVYGLVLLGAVEIERPEDEIGAALDDAMAYADHEPDHEPDSEPEPESESELKFSSEPEPELPERSYSDVFRELRGLGGEHAPEPLPSADAPGSEAHQPAPGGESDEHRPTPGGESEAPPRRPARSAEDGDVSEFLRELSRLALDDQQPAPERPRRASTPPARDPKDDDNKRKRRNRFGRG